MLRCIFLTKLSDMTYGFRIFPSDLVKEIKWQELKHPFLLETILKPLLKKYQKLYDENQSLKKLLDSNDSNPLHGPEYRQRYHT